MHYLAASVRCSFRDWFGIEIGIKLSVTVRYALRGS